MVHVQQHLQREEVSSIIPLSTLYDFQINPLNDLNTEELDFIAPQFYIPELKDRPQDPIIDALESLLKKNRTSNDVEDDDKHIKQLSAARLSDEVVESKQSDDEDIWTRPEVIAPSRFRERLVPKVTSSGAEIKVTLEGIGHDTIASVLKIFLNIGTNVRRVDNFIIRLGQNRSSATATMHAFSYSLNSVLSYVQSVLSQPPPLAMKQLVGISRWYQIYDQILTALVSLCRCNGNPPFHFPPKTPSALLDHLFGELKKSIAVGAPRKVTATLAYILTITSKHYFRQLSSSIGLLDGDMSSTTSDDADPALHFEENGDLDPTLDMDDNPSFPNFFPQSLVVSLPAARKSLSILKSAGLDCRARSDVPCTWVWTDEELDKRWFHDQKDQYELGRDVSLGSKRSVPQGSRTEPNPDNPLGQFAIFDLQPGSHSTQNNLIPNTHPAFSDFLTTFPESLPNITPSLAHLTELVLNPLSIRTTVLSNLSLRLFLDSLHFETHLRILRSYFFLILPSFKNRLVNALFHDDSATESLHGKTTAIGLGLAQGLGFSNKKIWPPKGSDLSFSLRNVIVNSLEEDLGPDENIRDIIIDMEQNLGFGLRDLPLEDGQARWLDPVSIEALDFLYLDYKTSPPLDVVVTPQIIAKYQRVFTYLLRLTRAGIVMRISYRNIYSSNHQSLPYASKYKTIAQSLYFQLQTFLNSLNGYTYDSVIGGTFDKYLSQIENIRDALHSEHDINLQSMNIFVLGESHSRLLDMILRCCLLRGSQRYARDALRDLLDLVLQFGTLIADLRYGVLKDFEAGERLVELNEAFENGMLNLVMGIRQLQETQDKNRNDDDTLSIHFSDSLSLGEGPTRDQSYLDELLTRLDPSYWWRRRLEKRVESQWFTIKHPF
ncbi:hypothetical protein Clacol_000998 [Clathrus columnatus]|uniref:Spindle pole body component n=1 Tax=Clathrus columnatus TaxID=1419009 RepID=A0AAV4ZZV3_9AGAM|nr:hypothetical protein Clacol_000998 [Clathrus columnatus]